jgi:hypothetical protein
MQRLGAFSDEHRSYGQIHQTRPLKLAIGLTDSPLGLAMWIYDICLTVVEDPETFAPETLITWTMMHWIDGPYAAMSLFKHGRKVRLPVLLSPSVCRAQANRCTLGWRGLYTRYRADAVYVAASGHLSVSP